ncbi:MAG: hypothetical protein FD138_2294 [Planctomycetota bacterium]|nr:MAG: hypothetical protein FD138_2294 [Planctomycetota bacterium]
MITQRRVGVGKDHSLFGEVFLQAAVDDFGFVLSLHAREIFLLGLRDAKPVVGLADVVGHVFPTLLQIGRRLHVVEDVLEVDFSHVTAPCGHRLLEEGLQRVDTEVPHPLRLLLHLGDLIYDLAIQSSAALEDVLVRGVVEPELVIADADVLIFTFLNC